MRPQSTRLFQSRLTRATTFWGGINFRCYEKANQSSNKEMNRNQRIQMSCRVKKKVNRNGRLGKKSRESNFSFKKPLSLSTSDSITNAVPIS